VADRYPDADSLLNDARASTGLDDFGPGDFRAGLEVLLASFERDTDLNEAAREVIALSSSDDPTARHLARELGAQSFFRKPVDAAALLDSIEWVMQGDGRSTQN